MNVHPKTFVAVRNFSCAGYRFRVGDPVPPSVALSAALRFGDRFVTVAHQPRKTTGVRPVADTTDPIPPTPDPEPDGDVDNNKE